MSKLDLRMSVCKLFPFDSAHDLPYYEGKCHNLHGHRWTLEVEVSGTMGPWGMVMDFAELKRVIHELVIDKFDHAYLNDIVPNPTAENLLMWILGELWTYDWGKIRVERLRLWEGPESWAEIRRSSGEA